MIHGKFSIRNYPITATPHGAGVGNVVLPGVGIDNLLLARECLCQPREAHHSPTSAGDDGLASSLLLLGVVLGYAFVLGVRPPNLLNARVRRGWLSAGLMKKLVNCWPHEHTW